jgi:hypothetical protein
LAIGCCGAALATDFTPDFRDLALGVSAAAMPTKGYDFFACGSDGNPPLQRLTGWSDYMKCKVDKQGLHEVDVGFSSDLQALTERVEQQYQLQPWYWKYSGTRVAGFAVIMSMLFDDSGTARGFRAVTDQRGGLSEREKAFMMPLRVKGHYGLDGWTCVDRPPVDGETPVGKVFINELCTKTIGLKLVTVESHLFRRRGQTGFDDNGEPIAGQYESLTRWETWDKAFLDNSAAKQ